MLVNCFSRHFQTVRSKCSKAFKLGVQVWTSSDQRIELYAQTRQRAFLKSAILVSRGADARLALKRGVRKTTPKAGSRPDCTAIQHVDSNQNREWKKVLERQPISPSDNHPMVATFSDGSSNNAAKCLQLGGRVRRESLDRCVNVATWWRHADS